MKRRNLLVFSLLILLLLMVTVPAERSGNIDSLFTQPLFCVLCARRVLSPYDAALDLLYMNNGAVFFRFVLLLLPSSTSWLFTMGPSENYWFARDPCSISKSEIESPVSGWRSRKLAKKKNRSSNWRGGYSLEGSPEERRKKKKEDEIYRPSTVCVCVCNLIER